MTTAILVLAIPAAAVLAMRFRKRWLSKFNILVTNRITRLFAGWLPGFGILTHVGRKSGKVYLTPINVLLNVLRVPNGFIIALTYSSHSEWVKNVLAAGGCDLKTVGTKYKLSSVKVVHDPSRQRFPIPVRLVLRLVGADEYMELSNKQPRRKLFRSSSDTPARPSPWTLMLTSFRTCRTRLSQR